MPVAFRIESIGCVARMNHISKKKHTVPQNCGILGALASWGRFSGTEFWRLWALGMQREGLMVKQGWEMWIESI